MDPAKSDRPSMGLFLLMTAVYFGGYFGLKYGVFGGDMPWFYNVVLIGICLLLAMILKRKFGA